MINKLFCERIKKTNDPFLLEGEVKSMFTILKYMKQSGKEDIAKDIHNKIRVVRYRLMEIKGEEIWKS